MANFFATGHGLIGGYLARQEQEDKLKRQNDAIAEFLANGGQQPVQRPVQAAQPSIVNALPEYQQQALGLGFSQPINTVGVDGKENVQPAAVSPQPLGLATGISSYPTSRNASLFQPAQQINPIQQPTQQPHPVQQPTQQLTTDWLNQATATLMKKGVPAQQAYAMASQIYQQRNAEYKQQQVQQEFPKLREALATSIRNNDRASAVSAILQIQQLGGKVPTELITWAAPNYQRQTNDLGDREVNSSFNPATGQFAVGQDFNKGQSPDAAARLGLEWTKFNYKQTRDQLGDQGKTWESKRGKGSKEEEVDPAAVAKNTGAYRKFMNSLVQNEDGTYKTKAQVEMDLQNANVKRQIAAYAAAAGVSPAQLRNDIEYFQSNLN